MHARRPLTLHLIMTLMSCEWPQKLGRPLHLTCHLPLQSPTGRHSPGEEKLQLLPLSSWVTTGWLSASQPFSAFPPDDLWAFCLLGFIPLGALYDLSFLLGTHILPLSLISLYLGCLHLPHPPHPFRQYPWLSSRSKPWDCLLTEWLRNRVQRCSPAGAAGTEEQRGLSGVGPGLGHPSLAFVGMK